MSDTPETQEAIERLRQGKINIFDEMARMERERDEAREVAENLVEYAHEFLVRLESWGKGYDRYEREMETIREAIAGCQKWKEAAR